MNHPVLTALAPVVALIGLGYLLGWRSWIRASWIRPLSNLVFLLLSPLMLFRTMSAVRLEQLEPWPVLAYFGAVALVFLGTLFGMGRDRRAAVLALATTYSNLVMIGIPLVSLAYGDAGLVILLTLISLHALLLLVSATVALELALAREGRPGEGQPWRTVAQAVRNAVVHPVPLPIMAGLLFAQTGWALPAWVDLPMALAAKAFAPAALLLVGLTLASTGMGRHLRAAASLVLVKNLMLPGVVLLLGWALGVQGLPLTVLLVAAALPIGANVFLFAQRYGVAQGEVTAGVALSTLVSVCTISLVLALRAG